MRPAKRPKNHKKSSRHERTSRKKYKNTSSRSWCWNDDLSGLFIDDINEAIRLRKSQLAYGKGSWKLVPKDSCEVYKDRKRRSVAHKRSELSSEDMISNDTEGRMEEDKTDSKKKLRKKYPKKMIQDKKLQTKNRRKKRSKSYATSTYSSTSQSTCYTNKSHLDNDCHSVDFFVDNIRQAIWPLYLTLLTVTAAVSVVWIFRRQRSSIVETQWHAPTPLLEHKSVESTMNDFDENAFRQPVGDLGKGVLDQQSEEVDANEPPNSIYFSQQLASLECTIDGKLTAPQNKFELSTFTKQSKLFGNDFIASTFGDRFDVNFSTIQQQVEKDDLDEFENDLERRSSNMGCHGPFSNGQNLLHIEGKLNITHKVVKNDEDMSITDTVHIPLPDVSKNASKDKKASLNNDWVADKENIAMNPYAAPSETNITVNEEPDQVFDGKRLTLHPDIPEKDKDCRETFLPNSAPSISGKSCQNYVNSSVIQQVVTFPVKRSSLLPDILEEDKDHRQTFLPNSSSETPQSFVLDVNDDLPKSNNGMLNSKCKKSGFSGSRARRKKIKRDENEIPDTVSVHKIVITHKYGKASKREKTVLNDGACNVCCTQALPANMMLPDKRTQQKCQTIKYENDSGNISDTQTFPVNLILPNNNTSPERQQKVLHEKPENPKRRRNVVYEDDTDNISVTQALLLLDDSKENNEVENILITQSFSNNIVAVDSKTSRHRTIVHETGNTSITQVKEKLKHKPRYSEEKPIVHCNTSSKARSKKRTTIVCDNNESHKFMAESISANIIAESKNERKSIVYNEDPASISMALGISANNYLLDDLDSAADFKRLEEIKKVINKVINDDIIEEAINKIKTITFNEVNTDEGEIFMTGVISTNIMEELINERKTMAYDDADSKSLAISTNVYLLDELDSAADIKKPEETKEVKEKVIDDGIIEEAINKIKTIAFDQVDTDEGDISMTGAVSTNIVGESTSERKTMAYDDISSKNLAISTNVFLLNELYSAADIKKPEEIKELKGKVIDDDMIEEAINKIETIAFDQVDTDERDISMTGAISTNIIAESTNERKTIAHHDVDSKSLTMSTNVYLLDKLDSAVDIIKPIKPITLPFIEEVIVVDVYEQDNRMPTEDPLQDNRKSTLFVANNFHSETSMTREIATVSCLVQTEKIRTVIFANDNCNISMKHPPPDELISDETELLYKTETKSSKLTKQNRAAYPQSDITVLQAFTTNSKQLTASTTEQSNSQGDDDSLTEEPLANISDQTLQRGTYDKCLMTILESDPPSTVTLLADTSTGSMFYIMKDSEVTTQTDRKMDKKANPKDEEEQVVHLQRQLSELKSVTQNSALLSRSIEIDKINEHVNIKQQSGNSSSPCDTQDLFDLISDLTGNVVCEHKVQPMKDQGETTEHKRVSKAYNGKSVPLSREDLWRNILMAEELLQKCRLALEDRECADVDTRDASVETSNGPDRKSYKVDKAFKFGDESISEVSLTNEEKFYPLKKTAFGETSYMYETKETEIPTHFKDASDGIKELMLDLVKPMSNDTVPVEIRLIDSDVKQNTSTHSAQIQANLATSTHKNENILKPKQSVVLVFDHMTPLNNILLTPNYPNDGHKYNPRETDETRCGSEQLLKKISKGNNYEAETLTTSQFTMMPEPITMQDDICDQKDDRFGKKHDQFTSQSTSTTSECVPVDQSVEAISRHFWNDRVNTIMEMRKNEDLLRESFSPELVEDASEHTNTTLTSDSNKHTNLKLKFSISPHVNITAEAANIVKAAKLSGISTRQRFNSSNSRVSVTNSKTRICSPSTDKHEQCSPSEEVTPEPISKIDKSSTPHNTSAVLSSPNDPTNSLRTEETFFIFVDQSFRPAVPVFDRPTSVNNILHSPTDLTNAHKNDPRKTDETLFGSTSSFNKMSKGDYEVEEASTTTQNTMVLGQHTDNTLTELVNTLHTLVNDESESENRVLTPDNEQSNHRIKTSRSILVDLEGQAGGIDSIAKITRRSFGDHYYRTKSRVNSVKHSKKQICIPSTDKYKQYSPSTKVIRKPITKMQKISTKPKPRIEPSAELYSADDLTHSMAPEKDVRETNNRDAHSSTICEKKSLGTKETPVFSVDKPCTKPGERHEHSYSDAPIKQQQHSSFLIFDHLNPLDNVLLALTNLTDVHKYNPRQTDSSLCGSGSRFNKISKDNDVETVTTTLYTRKPEPTTMQDDIQYNQKGVQSDLQYASSTSGSISVEESRINFNAFKER